MKSVVTIFLLLCINAAFSQQALKGKVISENHVPLPGASVFIPNTAAGTTTDKEGNFILSNLPAGNFKLAVTYIGYEVATLSIAGDSLNKPLLVQLHPRSKLLDSVVVRMSTKGGWSKWGQVFTDAFIGTSVYASDCQILNKDAIRFAFLENQNQLHAYADAPIIIVNRSLGYQLKIELVDFTLDVSNNEVDYQMYSFFTPMIGNEEEMIQWKKVRKDVYSLSLMHFMRALYSNALKQEGYDIRLMERKQNLEKERVKEIYNLTYQRIRDSLNKKDLREKALAKLIEKSFPSDSLKYYRRILKEDDRTEKVFPAVLTAKDISTTNANGTVNLDFRNYLVVTYRKEWEPSAYYHFRTAAESKTSLLAATTNNNQKQLYPITILNLTAGIPVEINENGYFNNIDLLLDGFWGWWEKIATKLPYDYKP